MKPTKVMLWTSLSLAFLLTACKSANESAGDKYLKGGDPINAIVQYEKALAKGKVSASFHKNYADANIQLLDYRGKDDPSAPILDEIANLISKSLSEHPDPETEGKFAAVLQKIAAGRINAGADEGAFMMLQTIEKLSNKPAGVNTDGLRKQVVANKLKDIEDDYENASSEPTSGILADYKMNKLALLFGGKEIPEMRDLWSKIRKVNLNTYLMYDYEGLITEQLDSRINKYGVLIAIVKLEKGSTATKVQAKVFNGASTPISVWGDNFTLVDREGNVYNASAKVAAFTKKDLINSKDESKTGGLTFKHPAGIEPWYLEFKSEGGVTRKYLP